MKSATAKQLRENISDYLDQVEGGETVQVLRHGKPVARILPIVDDASPSWKKPGLKLSVSGSSLSQAILKERKLAKR